MTLQLIRIGALVCAALLLAVLVLRAGKVKSLLWSFLFEPSAAFNLAALRLVVFGMLFELARDSNATYFVTLPEGMRSLPFGWNWLAPVLPFDVAAVVFAERALLVTSALAMVGLATVVAAPLAVLFALYVLGLPNFYVKVDHPAHIVMLCAMVLSVSPCADTLALDALFRRRAKRGLATLSSIYTTPVRCCWLLVGTVYLFPGVWKLWLSGDLWMSGYQLLGQLYDKWGPLQNFEPPMRIDRHPLLLAMLGTGTLLFEIGFIFALFNPYTRIVAAFSAVSFHLGVAYFLDIHFHALFPLVLLLDFPQLWQRLRARLPATWRERMEARQVTATANSSSPPGSMPRSRWLPGRRALPAFTVGMVLFAAQLITGFGRINTWPVSVHPTFSGRQREIATRVSRVALVLEPAGGAPAHELPESAISELGSGRLAKLIKKIKRVSSRERDLRETGPVLVQLFRRIQVEPRAGDALALYDTSWDLFPLGQRAHYQRTLTERFIILSDLSLTTESQAVHDQAKAERQRLRKERRSDSRRRRDNKPEPPSAPPAEEETDDSDP